MNIWIVSCLGLLKLKVYEHWCTSLYINIYFLSLGVEWLSHTAVGICLSIELPNCFPKWLHRFASPLAVHRGSSCSTFSPTRGRSEFFILDVLVGESRYLFVVFICISLMTNGVILMLFFAIRGFTEASVPI